MAPVRVLVVDDDVRFRHKAAELLTGLGYDVVAQAGDGDEALAECARTEPHAALIDVNLPDTDGFTLARALRRCPSQPRVLLTSTDDAAVEAREVTEAGAIGFLPKMELAVTDLAPYLGA